MSGGHRLHTSGVLSCFHSILVNPRFLEKLTDVVGLYLNPTSGP